MNNFAKLAALASLTLGLMSTTALAETTINALFMAQAAYSEADVRAMTDAFTKANPDVKVNLEFVPYEGLHDKIMLAQGAGSGPGLGVNGNPIWALTKKYLMVDEDEPIPLSVLKLVGAVQLMVVPEFSTVTPVHGVEAPIITLGVPVKLVPSIVITVAGEVAEVEIAEGRK